MWKKREEGTPEAPASATPSGNPERKPGDVPEKSLSDMIAEGMKPFNDRLDAMQARMESAAAPRPAPAPASEIPSVLDDENAAFNARLTPVLAHQFEIEAKFAKTEVEREYRDMGLGDMWDQNRKEIEDFLANSALVTQATDGKVVPLRGDPNFIRNVADMVLGRVARKKGLRFDGKDSRFFLEDATGETALLGKRPDGSEGLTKRQIEAAKRFGVSMADYKKSAGKLDFVQ